MAIAQKYNYTGPLLANYDYTDLASGIGIKQFHALIQRLSGSTSYVLSDTALDSDLIESAPDVNLTFTSGEFNLPRYVKGTAYLSAHYYKVTATTYVAAQLQHWDGTTATNLTDKHFSANGTNSSTNGVYLEMPITTEKMVKRGESLRVVVNFLTSSSPGDNKIGHSPTNQTSPTGNLSNTTMVLGVPFRVNTAS